MTEPGMTDERPAADPPAVDPAPARRGSGRPGRGELVGGLLAGGGALTLWGTLTDTAPGRADLPGWLTAGLVLLALTLVVALTDHAAREPFAAPGRGPVVVAALVAALCAGLTGRSLWADLRGGLLTTALPALLLGLVAVTGGLVAWSTAPWHRPAMPPLPRSGTDRPQRTTGAGRAWARARRASRRGIGVGALVAVVLGAAGLGIAAALTRAPVSATTASAAPATGELTVPRGVAWTYELPGGATLGSPVLPGSVVPAGPGVAVATADGVLALDGRTGDERWSYRVAGAEVVQMAASPGGERVVVILASGSADGEGTRLVALDGATGEVGLQRTGVGAGFAGGFRLEMTDTHLVAGGDDTEVEAWGLDGGADWTWTVPEGCQGPRVDTGGDTVVVAVLCQDGGSAVRLQAVGLAGDTGEPRWDREWTVEGSIDPDERPYASLLGDPEVSVGADGSAVRVELVDVTLTGRLVDAVLRTDDGEPVVDPDLLVGAYPVEGYDRNGVTARTPDEGTGLVRWTADGQQQRPAGQIADALVAVCPVDTVADPVRTVQFVPWDGGPSTEIDVELGFDLVAESEEPFTGAERLLVAPGVLVIWAEDSNRLIALG